MPRVRYTKRLTEDKQKPERDMQPNKTKETAIVHRARDRQQTRQDRQQQSTEPGIGNRKKNEARHDRYTDTQRGRDADRQTDDHTDRDMPSLDRNSIRLWNIRL